MDSGLLTMIFKIVVFLPFIIFLIYIALKYGGTGLQKMQNGRFIKILERVQVSKDNSIMVVKMGEKSYVMTSTPHSMEILRELDTEEDKRLSVQKAIPEYRYRSLKEMYVNFKRRGDKND